MSHKISKALILFAALFLVTETVSGFFFSLYRYNSTNSLIGAKIAIAQKGNLGSYLLIFSGSEGVVGIDTKLLEELTGRSCFNFSLIGDATLAGEYFLFEEYLKHNPPPKYLLLLNAFDVWARGFDYSSVSDTLMINFPVQTARFFGRSIFTRLLPSQRYRYEIRALLRSGNWGAYIASLGQEILQMKDDFLKQRGSALLDGTVREDLKKDLKDHEDFVQTNAFSISALNRYGLESFLRKAREKGIIVFVSFGPTAKALVNRHGNSSYLNAYRSFMRTLPQRYPGVILLNDDFFAVDEDHLLRTIAHLNRRGAEEFTRWLAVSILRQEVW